MNELSERVRKKLQNSVEKALRESPISIDELARKLGILAFGVELLFKQKKWSFDICMDIAEAIGMDVDIECKKRGIVK